MPVPPGRSDTETHTPLSATAKRRKGVALVAALIAWLPVEVMSVVRAWTLGIGPAALVHDQLSMIIRTVVCIPLFILADEFCMARLWIIVDNFVTGDVVEDRERFDSAVRRARGAMSSRGVYVAAVILAYAATGAIAWHVSNEYLPAWHRPYGPWPVFSPAGWWHALVSLPMLLALVFIWLWRLAAWDALLWRAAHTPLRLLPSHPDGSAGLGFVGDSVRAFALVGTALSSIAAARAAQVISLFDALPRSETYFYAGFVVAIVVVFVGPLFAFWPQLRAARRDGALRYGTLARRVGLAFERRWLPPHGRAIDHSALEVEDFSALIDLYSVTSIAGSVRFIPISRRTLTALVLWLVTPFVPVALMVVPLHTLLLQLKGLFF